MAAASEKVNRSSSFRSARSNEGPNRTGSSVAGGDTAGAERFFQLKRGGTVRQGDTDAMSETSSQQERKFSALLGGPDPYDLLVRPGPSVTGAMNVGKRLYVVGVNRQLEKEEHLQNIREQILMREMSEMTQRPAITRRARQKEAKGKLFAEHGFLWIEQKQEHLEELKRERRDAEVVGVQSQPTIEQRSAAIVGRLPDYQGPVSGWESHFAKFCAKKAPASTPRNLFQPNINSNAVRMDVEKDIATRLFEDSTKRDQKRQVLEKDIRDKELIDPNTGRPLFSPQPLDVGRERRSPDKLAEELLAEGKRIEEKKVELQKKILQSDPNMTFSPNINKRSAAIAESRTRRPLYETPKHADPSSAVGSSPSLHDVSSPASKNGTGASDKKKTPSSASAGEFLRRVEMADMSKQQRLDELQRNILREEQQLCSFHPRINRKSLEICEGHSRFGAEGLDAVRDIVREQQERASPHSSRRQQPSQQQQQPAMFAHVNATYGTMDPYSNNAVDNSLRQPMFATESASRTLTPRRALPHADSASIASGKSPRQPTSARSAVTVPQVDEYVQSFEQQMVQVLDEWRRLEGGGAEEQAGH